MRKIVFIVLLQHLAQIWAEETVSYSNYRVYTVAEEGPGIAALKMPYYKSKLSVLLERNEFDCHNKLYTVRSYLVPRSEEEAFRSILDYVRADYNVSIDDLGREIEEEKRSYEARRRQFGTESVADTYYGYEEMADYLHRLGAVRHPYSNEHLAVVEPIGRTYEGRSMYLVKISTDHYAGKPIIFFEAGIHAREWTAPAAALYMMHQLVHNFTHNARLLDDIDFYIIPLSNPDGYEYSRTIDRLWRKTRSRHRDYYGVDGNRNFDFHWGEKGTSRDPDSNIYIGPYPFSEYETRNIRDAGKKVRDRIKTFVSIHAYGQYIVYPWSYKRTAPASEADLMDKIGKAAAKAIKDYNGTEFKVGNSALLMYEAAGGSDDYFKGVLGVDLSFTVELSSGTRGTFMTPSNKLPGIVAEAYEGFKVMARFASKYGG